MMLRRGVDRGGGSSAVLFVGVLSVTSACSLPPLSMWHPPSRSGTHYAETGTASWYGPGFIGNRTSSGEVYNLSQMTAAHPTLPLGTRVMVTNLENGRSVEVRVNDRGPFAKSRIIDLSRAAAREIGLIAPGTAQVRLESIDDDGAPGIVAYAVQAGAFQNGDKATALRADLARRFADVYLSQLDTSDARYYRVRVGPFERRDDAVVRARALAGSGFRAMVVEEVRR
jgi:peptidoglycan lytic transglycosylase